MLADVAPEAVADAGAGPAVVKVVENMTPRQLDRDPDPVMSSHSLPDSGPDFPEVRYPDLLERFSRAQARIDNDGPSWSVARQAANYIAAVHTMDLPERARVPFLQIFQLLYDRGSADVTAQKTALFASKIREIRALLEQAGR